MSTKASQVTVIYITDDISIYANYTINAQIVLCSDVNEPTSDTELGYFEIDNTNLIKEGLPKFIDNRTPTFIKNLSEVAFGIHSMVENVPMYNVIFKGIQPIDIEIVFPLKVNEVVHDTFIYVYYYDGTTFTEIQPKVTQYFDFSYKYTDANLESTDSMIIVVLAEEDQTNRDNWICGIEKDGCWGNTDMVKIRDYYQGSGNVITYALSGTYGYYNGTFELVMTNVADEN